MATIKVNFPHLTTKEVALAKLEAIAPFVLHQWYPDQEVGANKTATAIIEVDDKESHLFYEVAGATVEILRDVNTRHKTCGNGCGCK